MDTHTHEASNVRTGNDIGHKAKTHMKKCCVDRCVMLVGFEDCE